MVFLLSHALHDCHGTAIVSNCLLWSVGLWVSVSLLKCRRNISKHQCSMKFLFKFEMERAALKGTKAFYKLVSTGTWDLEQEQLLTPSQWEKKCFESSSLTYTVVVMSRPARERHILKWILASWKRLPRRDTVHKNNFGGTGMFSCSCGCKVLARRAVWPDFELLSCVHAKDHVQFCLKVLKMSTWRRLLWTFNWPYCTEAFRCHLMICKRGVGDWKCSRE